MDVWHMLEKKRNGHVEFQHIWCLAAAYSNLPPLTTHASSAKPSVHVSGEFIRNSWGQNERSAIESV